MKKSEAPTVEEQLSELKISRGSGLGKLIEENQDLHLLGQEEVNDKAGLPPWLRVYWRKRHPKQAYSPNDPTGGYPRVLKKIYLDMRSQQNRDSSLAATPESQPAPSAPTDLSTAEGGDEERAINPGSNVRTSGQQFASLSESDIRVNYNDTSKIIAASNGAGPQPQFYSTNGGTSWSQTTLPLVLGDERHSDPTVDWTSDGTAWATTIGLQDVTPTSEGTLRLRSYKSTDGGSTWTFDGTISGNQTSADKQMMWVDHSATSPFKDNIYVIWHNEQPVFVNRRTGPSGSWQTPVRVSGGETTGTGIGGDIKTNSSGDVFAFWPDTISKNLFVAKSTNGGATFSAPVRIARTFDAYDIGVPSFATRRALIYISGGAYRTATKDLAYAVWTDLSGVAGCNSGGAEPGTGDELGTNVASTCKTRIWFSRSTDGGATWQAAKMVNNQASRNDQFNPCLAVDETNGALVVIYYDTVNDPGRRKTDLWVQSSSDDGATWSTAVKVTTAQTDETGSGAELGNQYGDYNGLSGYDGRFFPCWTDRRNGLREEIWTSPLRIV